jgi:hypothetical protein
MLSVARAGAGVLAWLHAVLGAAFECKVNIGVNFAERTGGSALDLQ